MPYETSSEVNQELWDRLLELDPQTVCRRSGAEAMRACGSIHYHLRFLDRMYDIHPHGRTINLICKDGSIVSNDVGFETALVVLSQLTAPVEQSLSRRWVSEKELNGGAMFFRGVHALPLHPLANRFGRDSRAFQEAGRSLGAHKEPFGDVSFSFEALPGIPLVFVLWEEDAEFPARVTVLFDASIEGRLPLDVILALVRVTVERILEVAEMRDIA